MTKNNPAADTTISDIHKTRERISDQFAGDIRAISADARKRQEQSDCVTVSHAKSSKAVNLSQRG
jgi:hypothetical protein